MRGTQNLIQDNAVSRIEIISEDDTDSILMKINGSQSSKISKDENLMFDYVNFINNNFIKPLDTNKMHSILVLGAGGFTIGLNDDINNYTFLDVEKDYWEFNEQSR